MVTLFVPCTRNFPDIQTLQRLCQRLHFIDPLEQGAKGPGVFAHPVLQPRHVLQRGQGQHVGDGWQWRAAPKIQRRRNQIKTAFHDTSCGATDVGRTITPAVRNSPQVRINGRPINAVGSSLSMLAIRAMPRPSLLMLPAQS